MKSQIVKIAMSFLSKFNGSKGPLSTPTPTNSATSICLVRSVSPAPPGNKRYMSVSVIFLETCMVPYLYKKGTDMNLVTSTDKYEARQYEAGGHTYWISIYSMPSDIVAGMVVMVSGLTYNMWKLTDGREGCSLTAYKFEACNMSDLFTMVYKIPYSRRELKESDLKFNMKPYDMNNKEHTFTVITMIGDETEKTSMQGAYGKFIMPKEGGYRFIPSGMTGENKTEVDVFCGYSGSSGVRDLEFPVMFTREGSEDDLYVSIRGRLYSSSIVELQTFNDWKWLGPELMPHARGDLFAILDPSKTKDQNATTDNNVASCYCTLFFYPKLGEMVRLAGIQVTYDQMVEMLNYVEESSKKSMVINPYVYNHTSAVNVMALGNTAEIKMGASDGFLEFWMVSNAYVPIKRVMKQDPSCIVKEMGDMGNFPEKRALAVYAVLKSEYEGRMTLQEVIKPSITTKRVKLDQ